MQTDFKTTSDTVINKLQSWWEVFVVNIPNLAIALVVLIASYLFSKLVFRLTIKAIDKKVTQRSVTKLIAKTASIIVVLSGLFIALNTLNLGKTLTQLLGAAGISGLVIGLALQGTLSNTISGIVLSFRKNIRLGNWIETNGFSGEVTDINLNYFVMKEADNNMVVIPNKTILENPFKNFSLTDEMRVSIECGVGYGSDLEKVKELTIKLIDEHFKKDKIDKPVEFYYTEFGGSSINFICRFWILGKKGQDKLKAKSEAILEIKKAFDKAGINIPFPIRTIQFDNSLNLNSSNENK
jgi:small conductance mechanosensitive channel